MGLLDRVAALESKLAALEDKGYTWQGVIVKNNGEIQAGGDPTKRWVKPVAAIGTNDSSPPVRLLCRKALPVGTTVIVGRQYGSETEEVLGVSADDLVLLSNPTGQTFDTSLHADNHGWERSLTYPYSQAHIDALSLGVRNLTPGRVTPSVAGGLKVDVGSYGDFGGYIGLDLSSHQPASGSALFVTVYLDNLTNTAKSTAGSAIADNTATNPPKATPTDDDYNVFAYVRLDGDATAFTDGDIDDPRLLFESGDTIPPRVNSSFADTSAPTAGEIAALNLRPGHIVWQGNTASQPNHAWYVDQDGNLTKVSQFATVPYRAAGAVGTGSAASQPRTRDSLPVSTDVQFKADVLIGGSDGDTPAEKLEVSGGARLSKTSTWHSVLKNVNSTSFPRLAMAGGNSVSDANYYLLVGSAYSSVSADITAGIQVNTSYDLAGESYRSNNYGLILRVNESTGIADIYTFSGSSSAGSDIQFTRSNGNVILYLDESAQAASIGTSTTGEAKLLIDQNGAAAAIPVLKLNQVDDSEAFFHFESSIGAAKPIDTAALGTYYGKIQVYVEGVGFKKIALYDS